MANRSFRLNTMFDMKESDPAQNPTDIVLVYSRLSTIFENRRQYFQQELAKKGLIVEDITTDARTKDNDEFGFLKVSAPFKTLCQEAEDLQLCVPVGIAHAKSDKSDNSSAGVCSTLPPFDTKTENRMRNTSIMWPFARALMPLFAFSEPETFFTPTQRIEIVWEILANTKCDPDAPRKRGIYNLLADGVYKDAYPLHDGPTSAARPSEANDTPISDGYSSVRQELNAVWASWKAWTRAQPLHLVRYYFGEKVAFYFAFMDVYTKALVFPAIIGAIGFLYGMLDRSPLLDELCDPSKEPGNAYMCPTCAPPACEPFEISGHEGCEKAVWEFRFDTPSSIIVAVVIATWAPIFIKLWKRKEACLAYQWGTRHIAKHIESPRPQYYNLATEEKQNIVTGELEPYVSKRSRFMRKILSNLCIVLLLFLLCGCLAVLVISRIAMYRGFSLLGGTFTTSNVEWARWTVHGLIFILVAISENIYHPLAEKLTNFERPRTESEFLYTFLWKLFIFELINEFLPFVYSAFLKGNVINTPADLNYFTEMCELGGCMGELVELTAVLLVFRLIVGNFMEIAVPAIKSSCRRSRGNKKNEAGEIAAEEGGHLRDFFLNEHELDGVSDDFMEMMVQFSFTTILIPVFPLAPLVCLINNIVEIRLDAQKFVKYHRRPVPVRTNGIGIWNQFMDIIIKVAVIFNAALISFTSEVIPRFFHRFSTGSWKDVADLLLTRYNMSDWHDHHAEEFLRNNITSCYFEAIRENFAPYAYMDEWWDVIVVRLGVFCGFCLIFYTYQWVINLCIPDVPHWVEIEILREEFLMKKSMEKLETQKRKWMGAHKKVNETSMTNLLDETRKRLSENGNAHVLNGKPVEMANGQLPGSTDEPVELMNGHAHHSETTFSNGTVHTLPKKLLHRLNGHVHVETL